MPTVMAVSDSLNFQKHPSPSSRSSNKSSNQTMPISEMITNLQAFDATKVGVKGLADAGLTTIPGFFVHTPNPEPKDTSPPELPLIDLHGVDSDPGRRVAIMAEVLSASEKFGFFQVVNHGVPEAVLEEVMRGVSRFNEQPAEVKSEFSTRDLGSKVVYNTYFDYSSSGAKANWRDTLTVFMEPQPPKMEELPIDCRDAITNYSDHIKKLGNTLLGLLSESLGLSTDHLKDMECTKGLHIVGHYYPSCPEPELTIGVGKHSDPTFLTILLQDQIGGLQVLHQNGWIDVVPLPGALVINIGDLLQLISNDKLKSVEHKVLANKVGPRISIGCFFRPNQFSPLRSYGPIKELLSEDSPPIYKEVVGKDYLAYYRSLDQDGKSALTHFML